MRVFWLCALLVGITLACSSRRGATPTGSDTRVPTMSTTSRTPADSVYAAVHRRLIAHGYRIDRADPKALRLLVRAPGDATSVEVRVASKGDSSELEVVPLNAKDMAASMRSLITVTHDATHDPTPSSSPP